MNIGLAYPAFVSQFRRFYPDLELIKDENDVENFDLIIFSGGEDINPAIYGQKNTYSAFNFNRDRIEKPILFKALELNKKILGVCRGHQLIHACLGGNLMQDIYREGYLYHSGGHPLEFTTEESITKRFFNRVNSMHHQAVNIPADSLKVTSTYGDIIESSESENIITVQFHPEFLNATEFFKFVREDWK